MTRRRQALAPLSWMAAAALCLSCNVSAGDYLASGKVPDTSGWNLVWADEFNGTSVDATKWVAETGNGAPNNPGWGNNEAEYYTSNPGNLGIITESGNSVLFITAKADTSYSGFSYTSARIKTQGKFSFQYGKVEARIKLPQGQGMWPAFWLLGDSISSKGWPACGEIDVLEMQGGKDRTINSTLHWANPDGSHAQTQSVSSTLASGVFADNYHIFGMVWDSSSISFQLDGYTYCTESTTPAAMAAAFANGKFFIILNLAVGGNYLNGQLPTAGVLPQSMYVDWVRVYQKQ
jgi:beta-glucanase (GH16 family)